MYESVKSSIKCGFIQHREMNNRVIDVELVSLIDQYVCRLLCSGWRNATTKEDITRTNKETFQSILYCILLQESTISYVGYEYMHGTCQQNLF